MIQPGDELGQYQVEALIGEGGMAWVFRVRHRTLGSLHALKLLSLDRPDVHARLLQEGRIQATMRHPHIVAVTDVVEHDARVGLIMEYVEGGTLEDLIQREGALPADRALKLLLPVVEAVAYAHARSVLHRDIKPANVLLDPDGQRARVADFGVGKALDAPPMQMGRTRAGIPMGTPGYMAPEQWADAASVDARADVFALGVVLYEALSAARAFEAEDALTSMRLTLEGAPRPLEALAPDCPAWLVSVVRRAMESEPDRRYEHAGAMAQAIEEGLREHGLPSRSLRPSDAAPAVPSLGLPTEPPLEDTPDTPLEDTPDAALEDAPDAPLEDAPDAPLEAPARAAAAPTLAPALTREALGETTDAPAPTLAPALTREALGETTDAPAPTLAPALTREALGAATGPSAPTLAPALTREAPSAPHRDADPARRPARAPPLVLALILLIPLFMGFVTVLGLLWLFVRPADTPPAQGAPEPSEEAPASLRGALGLEPRVGERGECLPGGRGALGYWYAGRWRNLAKGQTVSMRRATNVREDYPREANDHSTKEPVVCVLQQGQRVVVSDAPISVAGGVLWVPVRAQDVVE